MVGPTLSCADVVWRRRKYIPTLPPLHPADQGIAERECGEFIAALLPLAHPRAFWVNSEEAAQRARKPKQLLRAKHVGLRIPETLMSNCPEDIRSFIRSCAGGTIYKTFHPAAWMTEEGIAPLYTTTVSVVDLPSDPTLQSVPGIYQEQLPKAYEVRAVFMGKTYFAVKVNSQASQFGKMDWRRDQLTPITDAITLPSDTYEKCLVLMRDLGLVFGSFDFVVTPSGEFVFLEVNETCQFLFLEHDVPSLPILDAFVRFLESQDAGFVYRQTGEPESLKFYRESPTLDAFLAAERRHKPVVPNSTVTQFEIAS